MHLHEITHLMTPLDARLLLRVGRLPRVYFRTPAQAWRTRGLHQCLQTMSSEEWETRLPAPGPPDKHGAECNLLS